VRHPVDRHSHTQNLQHISSGFGPMNELFERTKAVFEYFNVPFEAAPPV
jgi:hypothetical protein